MAQEATFRIRQGISIISSIAAVGRITCVLRDTRTRRHDSELFRGIFVCAATHSEGVSSSSISGGASLCCHPFSSLSPLSSPLVALMVDHHAEQHTSSMTERPSAVARWKTYSVWEEDDPPCTKKRHALVSSCNTSLWPQHRTAEKSSQNCVGR